MNKIIQEQKVLWEDKKNHIINLSNITIFLIGLTFAYLSVLIAPIGRFTLYAFTSTFIFSAYYLFYDNFINNGKIKKG